MSTITVKNAVKKFKNSTVIDNVSLTLEGGNIYGFVGRNGSGKTMLFRAISGLIHLTSGSIEIDGKVLHKDIDALPSVGIAIENAGLFPDLSGYKNLKLLAGIKKKISKDKIRETISEVLIPTISARSENIPSVCGRGYLLHRLLWRNPMCCSSMNLQMVLMTAVLTKSES